MTEKPILFDGKTLDVGNKKEDATLQGVYNTVNRYLFVTDYNRIDVILATALSNQMIGTPIWIFIVGNSGDWKSAFAQSLSTLPNCIKIDQITKNTLATGMKETWDLGQDLQNKSTILFFPDLAALTSANTDEKNMIWGQFRSLYDGDIYKSTGSGVKKAYENCHVTIVACTTQAIRDEVLVHAQLGTRELLYDTSPDKVDNDKKMDAAWDNEGCEENMKRDLQDIVKRFIAAHNIKDIKIPPEIKTLIKKQADKLAILRASATTDRRHGELINPIYPEVPTRCVKQFKRLYISLKSLDDDYTDEKCMKIIEHIVESSGNPVRRKIVDTLKGAGIPMNIKEVSQKTGIGRKSLKRQLEILWNLKVVEKTSVEERIGGFFYEDNNGHEKIKGGRIEEVFYYKYKAKKFNQTTLKKDTITG